MKYLRSLVLLAALVATPGIAHATGDNDPTYCATTRHIHQVVPARDAAQMRRLARELGVGKAAGSDLRALASTVTVTREGEIAVIEADETLVMPANPFDLQGRAIRFLRHGSDFAVGREKPGLARPIGKRLDLRTYESQRVEFDHGATFPFGDEVYTGMWINATGNLTFTQGDRNPYDSLQALVGGLPRIAPLLLTYNPRAAPGKGGIYYWVDRATREIRVTWLRVPIRFARGTATFQVRLRPDGRITFAYEKVDAGDGIVGVFPPTDGVRVLDLRSELPAPPASGAVAEEFSEVPYLNHTGISRTFLEHFDDRYDFISTWFDFPVEVRYFFMAPVRNGIQGIGVPRLEGGMDWGSPPGGTLSAYLFMNSLDYIPDDPDAPLHEDDDSSPSVTEILGQEAGHRWGSFVRFRDPRTGEESDALLGRQRAHWNFNLDTDASVMEGNEIADNGDGTFTTLEPWVGYSDLDLYLMGLAPPSAVPPFFFVEGEGNPPREASPTVGVKLTGERVNVLVDDVIAVEGERRPSSDQAPKSFRMAFVLVTRPGEAPRPGSVAKLDAYRQRWVSWWAEATGFNATFDTTLEDPRQ